MRPKTTITARVRDLTRALHNALELGVAHLDAAVEASGCSRDRSYLVTLACGELAHAVDLLDERRKCLAPLTADEQISDRNLTRSILELRAIAEELRHAPS
jgi:hypothetical protein